MVMELRKTIKRPVRFRPDSSPEPLDTFIPVPARPAFRPPFVDFNPNLPPCAFPTLDEPRPQRSNAESDPSPTPQGLASDQTDTEQSHPEDVNKFRHHDDTAPQRSSAGSIDNKVNRRVVDPTMEAARITQDRVFRGNLAILGSMRAKTDEDWIMDEMATSDEDTPSQEQPLGPTWTDLHVSHRMAIVDELHKTHSLGTVYAMLNLSLDEQMQDIQHRRKCDARDVEEEKSIAALQTKLTTILTADACMPEWQLPQSSFQTLVERHLYKDLGDLEEMTCTAKELMLAQRFVKRLGLEVSILGQWTDISSPRRPACPTENHHSRMPNENTAVLHGQEGTTQSKPSGVVSTNSKSISADKGKPRTALFNPAPTLPPTLLQHNPPSSSSLLRRAVDPLHFHKTSQQTPDSAGASTAAAGPITTPAKQTGPTRSRGSLAYTKRKRQASSRGVGQARRNDPQTDQHAKGPAE
ncbi:MAG: hypothetical protein M1817_003252 [Caeruleum heppii]|nr:MAG: hypothetical protein M1817_003252 [Caeruleum heppii]